MPLRFLFVAASLLLAAAPSLHAQQGSMPGMDMPAQPSATQPQPAPMAMGPDRPMSMEQPRTLEAATLTHESSGTTVQPPSVPMAMWMGARTFSGWQLMLHGNGFLADIQQHATASPVCGQAQPCANPVRRGGDKLFSTNWIMPMAMRRLGPGTLTLRTMLDLEPATIRGGFYPELFQQGETAGGRPIVDGQHPHDFIMELAALYDIHVSERTLLSLYAAPVGDPAIGPTAYPHRLSASEDPLAALGHHQEDSTHIAFNVVTAGLSYRQFRLEGSGFHGAEPTDARWHFQPSPNGLALDSYSTRLTWVPTANLSAQYSIAHLTSPEQLHPAEDQRRQTASVMYTRPLVHGNWSNTLLWGQAHSLADGSNENSYLAESLLNFHTRDFVWTRIEVAGRSSELITRSSATAEAPIGHVQAYSLGYDREYRVAPHLLAAPGAQFTLYRSPDALAGLYGRTPIGGVAFLRFRIGER